MLPSVSNSLEDKTGYTTWQPVLASIRTVLGFQCMYDYYIITAIMTFCGLADKIHVCREPTIFNV